MVVVRERGAEAARREKERRGGRVRREKGMRERDWKGSTEGL